MVFTLALALRLAGVAALGAAPAATAPAATVDKALTAAFDDVDGFARLALVSVLVLALVAVLALALIAVLALTLVFVLAFAWVFCFAFGDPFTADFTVVFAFAVGFALVLAFELAAGLAVAAAGLAFALTLDFVVSGDFAFFTGDFLRFDAIDHPIRHVAKKLFKIEQRTLPEQRGFSKSDLPFRAAAVSHYIGNYRAK